MILIGRMLFPIRSFVNCICKKNSQFFEDPILKSATHLQLNFRVILLGFFKWSFFFFFSDTGGYISKSHSTGRHSVSTQYISGINPIYFPHSTFFLNWLDLIQPFNMTHLNQMIWCNSLYLHSKWKPYRPSYFFRLGIDDEGKLMCACFQACLFFSFYYYERKVFQLDIQASQLDDPISVHTWYLSRAPRAAPV